MMSDHYFIIGYMGAGKSSIGQAFAARLKIPFVDLDTEIIKESGMTIPEIFEHHGEETFRAIESDTLTELVKGGSKVIACGGGTILSKNNRKLMAENGLVIYLEADIDTLYKRSRSENRPLRGDNIDQFAIRFSGRQALYEEAADVIIDATLPKDEIVEMLIELFSEDQ